ncbi:hypothetical protein LGW56_08985 [Streptococcus mutans]|nr:hypothetical protein [Streptococcus mutans]
MSDVFFVRERETPGCNKAEATFPYTALFRSKGYLGSLGSIDVLDSFINDDSIPYGSIMLVVSFGIDPNVEALIIRK